MYSDGMGIVTMDVAQWHAGITREITIKMQHLKDLWSKSTCLLNFGLHIYHIEKRKLNIIKYITANNNVKFKSSLQPTVKPFALIM